MCGFAVWHWQFTSTSSMWDKCSALACLMQFPALVTNTTGTLYFPLLSTRFLKHCLAAGIGVLPRTSTPSMSKRSPKELEPCGETWASEERALSSVETRGRSLTCCDNFCLHMTGIDCGGFEGKRNQQQKFTCRICIPWYPLNIDLHALICTGVNGLSSTGCKHTEGGLTY